MSNGQLLEAGAQAKIVCAPSAAEVAQMTLLAFNDSEELRKHWQAETSALQPPLEDSPDACREQNGMRKWGFGNIACMVDEDTATILWTDQRIQAYGVLQGSSADVEPLFEWWQANARRIGRAADEPVTEPGDTTPQKAPPLVRVPGPPRAISCAAVSDPIPDLWDRTWKVTTIDFLVRPKYERVVINLERTGKNRTAKDTAVSVERMPVRQLDDAVPAAPRPSRGRTAIVVRMPGVRNAPDLRAYHPVATDIVKELSVVRGGGSRTAVLAVSEDACYQVRVPIFGPSASGKEHKAEIYIDLKK